MNNNNLFSVLIANYNNGHFFNECYQSILSQTYTNWEIIIVDDSSSDNSVELIREITKGDNRVHIYINEKNKGCGYTKHRCSSLANGDICGFLDSDDALKENAIMESIKTHNYNPKASLVYSTHYVCDALLNVKYVTILVKKQPKNIELIDACYVSHFATYKNNLYNTTNGTNPKNLKAVDRDLYYLLEELGDIVFIDKPLYYYRNHEKNISLNKNWGKAEYWDWVIRHQYAIKRGRNLEDSFADYLESRLYLGRKLGKISNKILQSIFLVYRKIIQKKT